MTYVLQMWLPILLSAASVFIASALIHNIFNWHHSDYLALRNEERVRIAIRDAAPVPGQYLFPYLISAKDLTAHDMGKKFVEGPVGLLIIRPNGLPRVSTILLQWLLYILFVTAMLAHVVANEANHHEQAKVFEVVAQIGFVVYGSGAVMQGVWMGRPWGSVAREQFDAAIYAVLTALCFAFLC